MISIVGEEALAYLLVEERRWQSLRRVERCTRKKATVVTQAGEKTPKPCIAISKSVKQLPSAGLYR